MSTILNSALPKSFLLAAALLSAHAVVADTELTGHVKTRALLDGFPSSSAFDALTGSTASALESDLRINLSTDWDAWSVDAAWQLAAGYGDRYELTRALGGGLAPGTGHLPNDDRRLMNLTDVLRDDDKFVALHRLDRLSLRYARDNLVVRVGRQAVTWGNGLVFSPMDIVNPFDPTAVDTEYKPGDDMLYAQYLFDNGNDIEFAQVFRRDPLDGEPEGDFATTALKYHGLVGEGEFDVLVARHYDETIVGIGGNRSVGGAVVHGDLVWTDSAEGSKVQLVTNLSYSWVWGGKNMSGIVEYYFSGFGQPDGRYDLVSLQSNAPLVSRLQRGEVFTLGRNYLAGGVTIEMSPLWMLTPNLFANLDDGSALLQLVSRRSLGDDAELLAAINLPLGPEGSEFGGIETPVPGNYLATDYALFVQFAWYF